MSDRSYLRDSIQELEARLSAGGEDPATLRALAAELAHRHTDRALALVEKVAKRLAANAPAAAERPTPAGEGTGDLAVSQGI
jgi:hypothetical protein